MDLATELGIEEERLAGRIRSAVKAAGGPAAVSEASGIPLSTLNKYVRGAISPSAVVLARIALATKNPVSSFYEDDEALFDRSVPNSAVTPSNASEHRGPDVIQIPILDVSASAGIGYLNHHEDIVAHLPFPAGFLRALGVSVEKARMVRSHGDSMEPTIPDDRLVLIDTADRDISRSKIFLVRTADGLRLKRILRAHDGAILLISDNKEIYPTERLEGADLETFKVIGRAVWTERLL